MASTRFLVTWASCDMPKAAHALRMRHFVRKMFRKISSQCSNLVSDRQRLEKVSYADSCARRPCSRHSLFQLPLVIKLQFCSCRLACLPGDDAQVCQCTQRAQCLSAEAKSAQVLRCKCTCWSLFEDCTLHTRPTEDPAKHLAYLPPAVPALKGFATMLASP